ncbi:MAG: asparagine synthase (glutamine-hydrolyzing) [Candidatus Hydrogenedentes bacterium]|nr:asparagine synthase (glutamine-hydrolyzing) [Candidatus Hydrogenedentota bacterium]
MCGIGGVLFTDPERPVSRDCLESMNAALKHRGPDGEGVWQDGPAGLCHRRLSILDLSQAAAQPMHSPDGRYVLSYNGEVYNYRDIRAELEAQGWRFHSTGDTEVVLAALATWGEAALHRFNGMFAIAFYDTCERALLLARDRIGIKPLYYAHSPEAFAFASELPALLRSGLVDSTLNTRALADYFTYLYIPAPASIYNGVLKLLPGHVLRVQNGRLRTHPWWELLPNPQPHWTLHSAAACYRELLEDAIRLRRISDVPLGAFLSGGIDSSSVVALLAAQSDRPVKTFTIGFDDAQMDELRFAREAAKAFGADHTEAILRPDAAALLPEIVQSFGEPFADSSALPTWLVSRIARQHVTVALSGDGGDELFAGYTWTHRALQAARYRQVPAILRACAGGALALMPRSPALNKVRRFHQDAWLSPFDAFNRRLSCLEPGLRRQLLREALRPFDDMPLISPHQAAWQRHPIGDPDRMLYVDAMIYLPDDILTKVDRMSMAHGLEARVPLLDYRMVEFAASVPFSLKFAQGISKLLVKEAVRGILPPSLLAQRKQGFAVPIHKWFRGPLAPLFQDTVLGADPVSRDYLDRNVVESLFRSHQSGRENHGHVLWAMLVFDQWLRGCHRHP